MTLVNVNGTVYNLDNITSVDLAPYGDTNELGISFVGGTTDTYDIVLKGDAADAMRRYLENNSYKAT